MVSQKEPGWSDLFLQGAKSNLEKGKKEPKGQTKILGPASVVCCLPQKDQPGNPGPNAASP